MFQHRTLFAALSAIRRSTTIERCPRRARRRAKSPIAARGANGRRRVGDQLGFTTSWHGRTSLDMKVLDLACGTGHGLRLVAGAVREAHGGDADPGVIEQARAATTAANVSFHVLDALATGFPDASFDAVLSMETVEHVDGERFLDELHRLMAPGALLVISTPQNSQGRIPITATHEREYTLEQAVDLVARRFTIREVIGLKQGRIIVPGDPRGQNTVIVAVKEHRLVASC